MALVGPRPEVRKWVEVSPGRWAIAHTVRPGITDPAAILYRDEERVLAGIADPERFYREQILPRKLDLYEKYVTDQDLLGRREDPGSNGHRSRAGAPADPRASDRLEAGLAAETTKQCVSSQEMRMS